jgi:hypothetical protein
MAKQRTKLKDFFEGKRRRCRLQDFRVLKDRKDILRMRLSIQMPLSNEPATGMNEKFSEPYLLMAKQDSDFNSSKVNVGVANASFHIFSTDTVSRAAVKSGSADLQSFHLVGIGTGESREVFLQFDAELPVTDAEDDALTNWAMKHLHADFFVEAVPAQMEIASDPQDPPPNGKKKVSDKQGKLTVM